MLGGKVQDQPGTDEKPAGADPSSGIFVYKPRIKTDYTVYRSVDSRYVTEYEQNGIRRPNTKPEKGASNGQGHTDVHWMGVYTSQEPTTAIGEAGNGTPGAMFEVKIPGQIKLVPYTAEDRGSENQTNYKGIWRALRDAGLVSGPEPSESALQGSGFIDSLAEHDIILLNRYDDKTTGEWTRSESIIPWKLGEKVTKDNLKVAELPVKQGEIRKMEWARGEIDEGSSLWQKAVKKNEDDSRDLEQFAECPTGRLRLGIASDACALAELDWDEVHRKAKVIIDKVLQDNPELKQRPKEAVTDEIKLKSTFNKTVKPEVERVSGGISVASSAFGAAAWAAGLATVFTDRNADTLDKVTALTAIVPGIGQATGIVNGIAKHNAEAIAVNSVAAAALLASQSIPLVGEITDVAFAGYAAAQGVAIILDSLHLGEPEATSVPHVRPVSQGNAKMGWLTPYDDRIVGLRPLPGYRTQQLGIVAENDEGVPLREFSGVLSDPALTPVFERFAFFQAGAPLPAFCKVQTKFEPQGDHTWQQQWFTCTFPQPVLVTKSHPVAIRTAYMTSAYICTNKDDPNDCCPDNPKVAALLGPNRANGPEAALFGSASWKDCGDWLALPYYVRAL